MIIFENNQIRIEREIASIPWLKIFTQHAYKELSDCPDELRHYLYDIANIIEKEMLIYYQADKINIASFANMLPQVHLHVQARFKNDEWFPQPTWGEKQRQNELELPAFEPFIEQLIIKLKKIKL